MSDMPAKPTIAFLGIGLMGAPQARRLLAAGYPLVAWNRTRAKAEALEPLGARIAETAAAAVAGADIVITMLENGGTVRSVLFDSGTAEHMAPGTLVIDMSSIAPTEARDHAARLRERGVSALDAPVSGGTVGAEQGTLSIMVGGESADVERARPVLAAMGRPTHVGPTGAGQIAKLANQMIVAITIGAVSEALLYAERAGADPAKVRTALTGGFADSRILDLHGGRIVARDFETRGKTSSQIKDLVNATRSAAEAGAPAFFSALALELFRDLLETHGDVDHSGLWLTLNDRKG